LIFIYPARKNLAGYKTEQGEYMFRVNVNGESYKVSFRHCEDVERYTVCRIDGDGWDALAEGMAICKNDNYERSIGRKLSMARAIEFLGLDKPSRSIFWSEYFSHCK
jgi:hypothetical protein